MLESDPSEPQLHRLVRFYERTVNEQANRLMGSDERSLLKARIRDLENTVKHQQATIESFRRKSA